LSLRSDSPTVQTSFPSIKMVPWLGSKIQHIVKQSVDFPEPVLPTIPIF